MSIFDKKRCLGSMSGFTLVELLIVIAVVIVLLASSMTGMISSRKYFTFSNAYEKTVQMVREARSNAVTGKATMDYTDYDQDGSTTDLVTPAGYGVYFDTSGKLVTLFADLHKSTDDSTQNEGIYNAPAGGGIGVYEAGKDLILATFEINASLSLVLDGGPTTIIYTPIFADIKFNPGLSSGENFFIFGVSEGLIDGEVQRHKCSKIHPVAGIPEVATDTECPSE